MILLLCIDDGRKNLVPIHQRYYNSLQINLRILQAASPSKNETQEVQTASPSENESREVHVEAKSLPPLLKVSDEKENNDNTKMKEVHSEAHHNTTPQTKVELDQKGRHETTQKIIQAPPHPSEMNDTHINGILMEAVHTNYTRNIYFTVKTTYKYYQKRLLAILLTWLQVVDKNKVSIFI